jgi:hypothetical protein
MLNDFFDWEGTHTMLYRSAFRGFVGFLELIAKMHGLSSAPRRPGRAIVDPTRTPDRLPIPTIPVRE